ncbi:hypothetical protein FBUS_07962 [Fasciolopsis buskii]|uniref:Uncharacterized protein n=1 Tax=Fasciolopsis buskii TaxID=27845 RepID=A0A8E0RVW2_9TREM|nr:hypothetical protein FBUS_07962 [Fasciolopsis buski]
MGTKHDNLECGVQPSLDAKNPLALNDGAPRFQHVQPGVNAYRDATLEALKYLNGTILQLSSIPNLYSTKETATELQKAADYLAQIRLEEELFDKASAQWHERFSQRELVTQRQALLRLKGKLTDPGGQFLARYRTNMDFGKVRCTNEECAVDELTKRTEQDDGIGWTATAVRAAHAWALQELRGLNSELAPLAEASRRRLEQYMDEIDVTDRYSGYRRSLGYMHQRSPEDLKSMDVVLESNIRPSVAPRWNLGPDWIRAEYVGTKNYKAPDEESTCYVHPSNYIRWSNENDDSRKNTGIVVNYPGRSEYQDSYLIPTFVETGMHKTVPPTTHRATFEQPPGIRGRGSTVGIDPAQAQNKGYGVNPQPNYLAQFSKLPEPNEEDMKLPKSETSSRFVWPDLPKPHEVHLAME